MCLSQHRGGRLSGSRNVAGCLRFFGGARPRSFMFPVQLRVIGVIKSGVSGFIGGFFSIAKKPRRLFVVFVHIINFLFFDGAKKRKAGVARLVTVNAILVILARFVGVPCVAALVANLCVGAVLDGMTILKAPVAASGFPKEWFYQFLWVSSKGDGLW